MLWERSLSVDKFCTVLCSNISRAGRLWNKFGWLQQLTKIDAITFLFVCLKFAGGLDVAVSGPLRLDLKNKREKRIRSAVSPEALWKGWFRRSMDVLFGVNASYMESSRLKHHSAIIYEFWYVLIKTLMSFSFFKSKPPSVASIFFRQMLENRRSYWVCIMCLYADYSGRRRHHHLCPFCSAMYYTFFSYPANLAAIPLKLSVQITMSRRRHAATQAVVMRVHNSNTNC